MLMSAGAERTSHQRKVSGCLSSMAEGLGKMTPILWAHVSALNEEVSDGQWRALLAEPSSTLRQLNDRMHSSGVISASAELCIRVQHTGTSKTCFCSLKQLDVLLPEGLDGNTISEISDSLALILDLQLLDPFWQIRAIDQATGSQEL